MTPNVSKQGKLESFGGHILVHIFVCRGLGFKMIPHRPGVPKWTHKAKNSTNSTKEFSEQFEGLPGHYPVKQGF